MTNTDFRYMVIFLILGALFALVFGFQHRRARYWRAHWQREYDAIKTELNGRSQIVRAMLDEHAYLAHRAVEANRFVRIAHQHIASVLEQNYRLKRAHELVQSFNPNSIGPHECCGCVPRIVSYSEAVVKWANVKKPEDLKDALRTLSESMEFIMKPGEVPNAPAPVAALEESLEAAGAES